MNGSETSTTEGTVVGDPASAPLAGMLNVGDVAKLLKCSTRTIYRLTDSGRLPQPVKLGALVRWPRERIEGWIGEGCPSRWAGRQAVRR